MLALGYIPVISTVGCGGEGEVYNISGDTAAARIAGALGAERLVLMTDTPGLLADKDDPSSLIRRITPEETEDLKKIGVISGGMIPKTECCAEALSLGVRYAVIIDGRAPHSVLNDLCSDESPGTTITGIK
jgi:acetylglutamate kinase